MLYHIVIERSDGKFYNCLCVDESEGYPQDDGRAFLCAEDAMAAHTEYMQSGQRRDDIAQTSLGVKHLNGARSHYNKFYKRG